MPEKLRIAVAFRVHMWRRGQRLRFTSSRKKAICLVQKPSAGL